MIGPLLSARINEIYAGYLDRDRFESSFPDESRDGRPTSMRNFLQAMSLPPVEHDSGIITPMLGDLDMLVSEFLETPFSVIRGDRLPMGVAVFTIFCASAVEIVKRDAFTFSVLCDDELKVALLQENDCSTMQQLSQLVSSANVSKELAQRFFLQLQSAWGPRTLRSFFVKHHLSGSFPSYWPGAKTGLGIPLKTMSVATASGTAQCEVSRYDEHEELPVRAYEWCTELRIGPQASEPDAIACGMVYVFERDEDGIPYGRLSDLMDAADSVADTDVLQVSAFLQQHGDAADLLTYSDVCFVWLWERRVGTPKGIGGDCLKAAVSNLKKRFGKMRLVVVDVKPTQFISWTDETDLPQIGVAKQEAIEAVMDRLDQLSVDDCIRGEVRPIINNRGGDPEAAMAALMMARFS